MNFNNTSSTRVEGTRPTVGIRTERGSATTADGGVQKYLRRFSTDEGPMSRACECTKHITSLPAGPAPSASTDADHSSIVPRKPESRPTPRGL